MKTQKILAVLLIFTFWFGTTGFIPRQSTGSELLSQPMVTTSLSVTAAATTFSRISPTNGAYGVATVGAVISWESLDSNYTYQYCLWPRQKKACPPGQWKNAGSGTSFTLPTLSANSTYYWQLRAKKGNTYVVADNGAWWSFHTSFNVPSGFSKLSPANNLSTPQPLSLTLSWNASTGNNIYYEYCYTTGLVGGLCAGPWYRSNNTSAAISGLGYDTSYYWQVRAS